MMREAGFRDVRWTPYTFGIAGLFTGVRDADPVRQKIERAQAKAEAGPSTSPLAMKPREASLRMTTLVRTG